MSTLDIRNQKDDSVTEIKYDSSHDLISNGGSYVDLYVHYRSTHINLCNWEDFDNFIAALHKARELWGPK